MPYRNYHYKEVINIRSKQLDLKEAGEVDYYLNNQRTVKNGYVEKLYDLTMSQLIIKAGFDVNTYPSNVSISEQQRLEFVAERLTVHFLKRKLDRIKQPEQIAFKSGSEILDPHHHLNSVYVKDNPHLLNMLPNFGAIYAALRGGPGIILDQSRVDELLQNKDVLTDTQFLGRGPSSTKSGAKQKLNPTVGFARGPKDDKEAFITKYAKEHNNVCRSCDMCGDERQDSLKDLERYINHTIRHRAEIIRVHIGETHIPAHGKGNVEQLFRLLDSKRKQGQIIDQIIRIGHGTHMGIESMKDCAKHGYYVECCLSSNKETGIIGKRSEYPLGLMLLLDVKVMLGTDGGDAYYTDIKKEYAYAKRVLSKFLGNVKNGSNEPIQLPNGDTLQYQHVKRLFKDTPQAQKWSDTKGITYKDLKLIEDICKEKISMNKLVSNMNEFKEKMFVGNTNVAVLDEKPTTKKETVQKQKSKTHWTRAQSKKDENKALGKAIKNLGHPSSYVFDVQDQNGIAHKEISFKDKDDADSFANHNSHIDTYSDDNNLFKVVLTYPQAMQLMSAKKAVPIYTENEISEKEKKLAVTTLKEALKQIRAIDASYVGHNKKQAIKDHKQLLEKQLSTIIEAPAFVRAMNISKKTKGSFHVIEKAITDKQKEIQDNADTAKQQTNNLLQPSYLRSKHQDRQGNIQLAEATIKKVGYNNVMIFDLEDANGLPYKEFSFADGNQAADFARHFSHANISQAGRYNKVILSNQQVMRLQQELQSREAFLVSTKYSENLDVFKAKAQEMVGKSQDNTNYVNAHPIVSQFCLDLEDAGTRYLKTGNKNALKTECQTLCNAAKTSPLKDHREWIGAIAKFVADVLSAFTCGLTDRFRMFARTDTVKKLDDFEQTVVNKLN